MKKIFLLNILFLLVFSGCQAVGNAERIADEFHEKLDAHDHDYIIDNLIDPESLESEGEDSWRGFLELISSWGEMTDRTSSSGFNYKSNNGISTVKLEYTFNTDLGFVYEALVLVDRGDGYKVMIASMNSDKAAVDEYTKDFD